MTGADNQGHAVAQGPDTDVYPEVATHCDGSPVEYVWLMWDGEDLLGVYGAKEAAVNAMAAESSVMEITCEEVRWG